MPIDGFGENLIVIIGVVLGLCKSFTKGSLFIVQTVAACPIYLCITDVTTKQPGLLQPLPVQMLF